MDNLAQDVVKKGCTSFEGVDMKIMVRDDTEEPPSLPSFRVFPSLTMDLIKYFEYKHQAELRGLASQIMKTIIPSTQIIGGGQAPPVWSKKLPLRELPHTLDVYRRILNLKNPPSEICLQDIVYWSNIKLHGKNLANGLPTSNKILTWQGMKWGHFLGVMVKVGTITT